MAIGAITTYTPMQGYFTNVIVIAGVFAIINLPSVGLWAACGTLLRNVLKDRRWLRLFNWGMAALLVVSLYPLVLDSIS
jgi:threonine/homoserine/homoserine lactone efflux protein